MIIVYVLEKDVDDEDVSSFINVTEAISVIDKKEAINVAYNYTITKQAVTLISERLIE